MKDYKEIISNERLFNVGMAGIFNTGFIKLTDAGTCSVMWCADECGWEHVSISPKKKTKTPTRQDMCQLKNIFFKDDEEALQIHPKKKEYVNVMDNCLHLWKPKGMEIMSTLDQCGEAMKRSSWIPITERLPENGKYVLVSFENFKEATIAKYEVNDEGGAFYGSDDGKSFASYELFVNAWMPLPLPYREEQEDEKTE